MARLTRHELKTDEFGTTIENVEEFARQNAQQLITGVLAALLVAAAVIGWRTYSERQQAAANAALGQALKTFKAEVSATPVNLFGGQAAPAGQFSSAQDKYKAALSQFSEVAAKYPRQAAGEFALYHVGLCQALLGNDGGAQKTLEAASHSSGKAAAALAGMALAGELAKAGKSADAARIYQDLADHPTPTVPRATALLAEADLARSTQPAQARALYEKVQKEFSSDAYLASTVRQQIESLPKP